MPKVKDDGLLRDRSLGDGIDHLEKVGFLGHVDIVSFLHLNNS